jgi:hypothetical protein
MAQLDGVCCARWYCNSFLQKTASSLSHHYFFLTCTPFVFKGGCGAILQQQGTGRSLHSTVLICKIDLWCSAYLLFDVKLFWRPQRFRVVFNQISLMDRSTRQPTQRDPPHKKRKQEAFYTPDEVGCSHAQRWR